MTIRAQDVVACCCLLFGLCFAYGGADAADETGEEIRDLGGLQQHPIRFFVPSAYLQGLDQATIRTRLARYVTDLNTLFARRTVRRFNLDANADVVFTDSCYSGSTNYAPAFLNNRSYGVDVCFFPEPDHSSMALSYDGDTLVYLHTPVILDRDALPPTINSFSGLNQYWGDLMTLTHEILHGFGAGVPENYYFVNRSDATGVAPIENVNWQNGTLITDNYGLEHPDYYTEPMATAERSTRSIDERLADFEFAELSRLHANGMLRWDVLAASSPLPNLDNVEITVHKADTESSPGSVHVMIWRVGIGSNGATEQIFDGYSNSDGLVVIPWQIRDAFGGTYRPWLLIKAFPNDSAEQATVRWVSQLDAIEEKQVFARSVLKIDLHFEGSSAPPNADALVNLSGQEDQPIAIHYEDLLAASHASDPSGQPLKFLLLRTFRGRIETANGEGRNHAALLGPGQTWYWHPPTNMNGADIPAFLVQARNASTGATQRTQIKVSLAAQSDLPRIYQHGFQIEESNQTWISCLPADDPDGGILQYQVLSMPSHLSVYTQPLTANGACFSFQGQGFAGTTELRFTVSNANGTSGPQSMPITLLNTDEDPPTVGFSIPHVVGIEDQPISFAVQDLLTALSAVSVDGEPLSLRVSSILTGSTLQRSDGTAVGNGSILSPSESLLWTPPANRSGLVTAFAVAAFDTMASQSRDLKVDLGAVNDLPTLDPIAGQTLLEDESVCLPLGLIGPGGGNDEVTQSVSLSASSADIGLIKNGVDDSQLSIEGSATKCLRMRARANRSGIATLTVTATDSLGASVARSFKLTVNPVNDAPVFVSGTRKFTSTSSTDWAPIFRDLTIVDADLDGITCRFLSVPTHADISLTSGSHEAISANTNLTLGKFKSLFVVRKVRTFITGNQTMQFRCDDPSGASTGAIDYQIYIP